MSHFAPEKDSEDAQDYKCFQNQESEVVQLEHSKGPDLDHGVCQLNNPGSQPHSFMCIKVAKTCSPVNKSTWLMSPNCSVPRWAE